MPPVPMLLLLFVAVCCTPNTYAEEKVDKKMEPPKVGDVAPDFEMKGTDGKTYKLSQFKGKSAVIVAWYPKALTGG